MVQKLPRADPRPLVVPGEILTKFRVFVGCAGGTAASTANENAAFPQRIRHKLKEADGCYDRGSEQW